VAVVAVVIVEAAEIIRVAVVIPF